MRLQINNTILNIFEAGVENYNQVNPSLVFLHYFGGSSRSWTEVIAILSADYHCLAPDLRGFGLSGKDVENYSLKDYADDVAELIRVLKLENFALIGHSMGGKIALAVAAENPPGLRSLVLLAPSPPTPEPMPEIERERLLQTHGDRRAAENTINKITAKALPKEIFELAVADNLQSGAAAWRSWLERGSLEDILAQTASLRFPALIAAGEHDELITEELLEREIIPRLKNAESIVVPGVKHLLPLEDPETIAALIRRHCDSLRKRFVSARSSKDRQDIERR